MSFERAEEYRLIAGRLRGLAAVAKQPEVQAELAWLAQSYERLAKEPGSGKVADGHRSLQVLLPVPPAAGASPDKASDSPN
jgi:hypothetical protein